jgi:hypothetical protein
MNREHDFDRTIRSWLDDGADRAPERFVWAALEDVERTAQRGAGWALLETAIMKLKPAAPILGVAAVVLVAIAAYQFLGGNVGGPPEPTPTPTPRVYVAEDLPTIVASISSAPELMVVDNTSTALDALNRPLTPRSRGFNEAAYVDARMANLNSDEDGGLVSWAVVFETVADADAAFDFLAAEHDSDDGWGMEPWDGHLALGDESAAYEGAAYDFDLARIHLWRVNNLLLAAVVVDVAEISDADVDSVRSLAEWMDERAH